MFSSRVLRRRGIWFGGDKARLIKYRARVRFDTKLFGTLQDRPAAALGPRLKVTMSIGALIGFTGKDPSF